MSMRSNLKLKGAWEQPDVFLGPCAFLPWYIFKLVILGEVYTDAKKKLIVQN